MGKSSSKNNLIFFGLIFFVLGVALTIFVIFQFFPTNYSSDKVLEGGYFLDYLGDSNFLDLNRFNLTVGEGKSMYPSIPDDSISIITNKEEILVGDIILFENYDEELFGKYDYIQHRVIKIREINGKLEYLTQGDNIRYEDGWVSEDYVEGKIVGVLY